VLSSALTVQTLELMVRLFPEKGKKISRRGINYAQGVHLLAARIPMAAKLVPPGRRFRSC